MHSHAALGLRQSAIGHARVFDSYPDDGERWADRRDRAPSWDALRERLERLARRVAVRGWGA